MDNNSAPLKSSVFGGFKKKDVLSYIFELNETTQDTQQKLAEQVEELVSSRSSLQQKTVEMQDLITRLQANLDDASVRADEEVKKNAIANELIEKLKNDLARYESANLEKSSELTRQMALNSELAEKNRSFEEKRAQVELAASQIAGLLGQARDDASKVVSRAHDEAAGITRDAKAKAEGILKNAKVTAESTVAEATQSIEDAYRTFGSFRDQLEGLTDTINVANASISDKVASITSALKSVGENVSQKQSVAELPTLSYKKEDDIAPAAAISSAATSISTEASNFTNDILHRYGVRKDDSGFFRLASDK